MLVIRSSNPPIPPAAPQSPPVNLPRSIRRYLNARRIWQTTEGRFALNDVVSRQVRRDTVRFGIDNSASLPGAIRRYLKARGIWQTRGVQFLLNDEHSRQVRRDTFRFRIDERYRMG